MDAVANYNFHKAARARATSSGRVCRPKSNHCNQHAGNDRPALIEAARDLKHVPPTRTEGGERTFAQRRGTVLRARSNSLLLLLLLLLLLQAGESRSRAFHSLASAGQRSIFHSGKARRKLEFNRSSIRGLADEIIVRRTIFGTFSFAQTMPDAVLVLANGRSKSAKKSRN